MVIEYFLEWVETAPVSKRIEAAGALVRAYLRNDVSNEEREDIEAAITTLTEDPAPSVRYELAQSFGAYSSAPRHIMSSLANDSIDISIMVLSQSPVFHDAELVEYASKGEEKQQISIACRPWLSAKVVSAIASHSCRDAVYAILVNPAAAPSQQDLHTIAVRHGTDVEIRNLLTDNNELASQTRLLLVEKLGSALGAFVSGNSWLSVAKSEQVVAEACDRASIIFAARCDEQDVRNIVQTRIEEGKLTVAYLLRAVCMGNITLVAHAFSELSGVKFVRVETVLTKDRRSAFHAIYDRAGLPSSAFEVFQTAISTWRDLLRSSSDINKSRLPFLVTKEVLSSCAGGQSELVDDLLVLLRKLSAEAARESAKSKAMEIAAREPDLEELEVLEECPAPEDASVELEEVQTVSLIDETSFAESLEQEIDDIEVLLLEEVDEVNFPEVPITPAIVDVGYLGSLEEEHLDAMYADIYDLSDHAYSGSLSKAA